MSTPTTLHDWRMAILSEVPFVGLKPFSHNIINVSLNAIAKEFGKAEANKAVRDFDLASLGWKEES